MLRTQDQLDSEPVKKRFSYKKCCYIATLILLVLLSILVFVFFPRDIEMEVMQESIRFDEIDYE